MLTALRALSGEPKWRKVLLALVRRRGELSLSEVARAREIALTGAVRGAEALEVVEALAAALTATAEETAMLLPRVAAAVTERRAATAPAAGAEVGRT
ncbi:MAG TPA: hypothetical protein VE289_03085 [Gaiellaceae bacterium]|jgi:hypothetical protein|nr:hypothetical protein [Gaiellaceae bacterium]